MKKYIILLALIAINAFGQTSVTIEPSVTTTTVITPGSTVSTSVTNISVAPLVIPLTQMQMIISNIIAMGFQTSVPFDVSKITTITVTKDTSPIKVFTTNTIVSVVIDTPAVMSYITNLMVLTNIINEVWTNEIITPIIETPAITHNVTNQNGNVILSYETPTRFNVQINLVP